MRPRESSPRSSCCVILEDSFDSLYVDGDISSQVAEAGRINRRYFLRNLIGDSLSVNHSSRIMDFR